ncbi:MAG: hypothetical protein V4638_07855 [Bacteroidota bacterium]
MINQLVITTTKCRITLLEPNLLENFVLDYCVIEVEDLLEAKKINQEITKGQPYAAILTFGKMTEVTKEAREQIASLQHKQNVVAKAILVNNIGHRLLGNFYLTVNKPFIKTRIFSNREMALKWLRSQLNEHNKVNSNKELSTASY